MAVQAVISFLRRVSGAAGSPTSLFGGVAAMNEAEKILYYGAGDDGAGNATSIYPIAGEGYFATKQYVTDAMAGAGAGDMLKSVYDPNNDGKVNSAVTADTVPWSGTSSGRPSTFPPSAHLHDAADVNSGTFSPDRIPTLDASKIGSGSFDAARIPTFDASKIGSGTIDPARLPILPSSVQIASAGGIADLTGPQQAEIGDGSIVTTTDGRRWVYTGSGSKTAEASYIVLADITPDWTAIANKPVFATVATSGAYGDLSGLPSLGTMAAQNANNVAITGGTISGGRIIGGTF